MSGFETVIYEKNDGIAYITLNRPKVLNAYNIKMRDELYQVLGALKADTEVKVGVIKSSSEKAFCAGADLSEFLTAPAPVFARRARFERDIWGEFMSVPQPIIAALNGYVIGSGLEIACFCDIRIASEDVQFCVPEMGLGIITAAGASQTLPRVINHSPAMEILLSGRWVKADEALHHKLVNQVVSRIDLLSTVETLAKHIRNLDPELVRCIKESVGRGLNMSLDEGIELESRLAARVLNSSLFPAMI
jgi:enoyl-CoA hydratase/carnithine racemase